MLTRIKEAWRVLTGKPSIAYFTNENGDFADGMFKDAIRVTFTSDNIRKLSSQAFACRLDSDKFTIPVVKCIPIADLTNTELLLPFLI